MAQRNAEIVRSLHNAFDEVGMEVVRDALAENFDPADPPPAFGRLGELLLEFVDPDVVVHPLASKFSLPDMPRGAEFRGWEGWTAFWRDWLEPWEDWWYEIGNIAESGDHVVLDLEIRARGRESGIPVEVKLSQVWTLRNGKIVGLAVFDTRAEALDTTEGGIPRPA